MGRIGRSRKNEKRKKQRLLCHPVGRPLKNSCAQVHSCTIQPALDVHWVIFSGNSINTRGYFYNDITKLKIPSSLCNWYTKSSDCQYTLFKAREQSNSNHVTISHSLNVESDLSWSLAIHGKVVQCPALAEHPERLTSSSLLDLLHKIDALKVCPGHPDKQFVQMARAKPKTTPKKFIQETVWFWDVLFDKIDTGACQP